MCLPNTVTSITICDNDITYRTSSNEQGSLEFELDEFNIADYGNYPSLSEIELELDEVEVDSNDIKYAIDTLKQQGAFPNLKRVTVVNGYFDEEEDEYEDIVLSFSNNNEEMLKLQQKQEMLQQQMMQANQVDEEDDITVSNNHQELNSLQQTSETLKQQLLQQQMQQQQQSQSQPQPSQQPTQQQPSPQMNQIKKEMIMVQEALTPAFKDCEKLNSLEKNKFTIIFKELFKHALKCDGNPILDFTVDVLAVKRDKYVYSYICKTPKVPFDKVNSKIQEMSNYLAPMMVFKVEENYNAVSGVYAIHVNKDPSIMTNTQPLLDVYHHRGEFVDFPYQFGDLSHAVFGFDPTGLVTLNVLKGSCIHFLIAGTTGSGKSVTVQSIILQALCHKDWLIYLDMKNADSQIYRDYNIAVAGSPDEACEMLLKLDKLFEKQKATVGNNISAYNKVHPNEPLPFVWIVFDEYESFMRECSGKGESAKKCKEAKKILYKIGSQGRTVGYHIIIGTQTPSAKNVEAELVNNLGVKFMGVGCKKYFSSYTAFQGVAPVPDPPSNDQYRYAGQFISSLTQARLKTLFIECDNPSEELGGITEQQWLLNEIQKQGKLVATQPILDNVTVSEDGEESEEGNGEDFLDIISSANDEAIATGEETCEQQGVEFGNQNPNTYNPPTQGGSQEQYEGDYEQSASTPIMGQQSQIGYPMGQPQMMYSMGQQPYNPQYMMAPIDAHYVSPPPRNMREKLEQKKENKSRESILNDYLGNDRVACMKQHNDFLSQVASSLPLRTSPIALGEIITASDAPIAPVGIGLTLGQSVRSVLSENFFRFCNRHRLLRPICGIRNTVKEINNRRNIVVDKKNSSILTNTVRQSHSLNGIINRTAGDLATVKSIFFAKDKIIIDSEDYSNIVGITASQFNFEELLKFNRIQKLGFDNAELVKKLLLVIHNNSQGISKSDNEDESENSKQQNTKVKKVVKILPSEVSLETTLDDIFVQFPNLKVLIILDKFISRPDNHTFNKDLKPALEDDTLVNLRKDIEKQDKLNNPEPVPVYESVPVETTTDTSESTNIGNSPNEGGNVNTNTDASEATENTEPLIEESDVELTLSDETDAPIKSSTITNTSANNSSAIDELQNLVAPKGIDTNIGTNISNSLDNDLDQVSNDTLDSKNNVNNDSSPSANEVHFDLPINDATTYTVNNEANIDKLRLQYALTNNSLSIHADSDLDKNTVNNITQYIIPLFSLSNVTTAFTVDDVRYTFTNTDLNLQETSYLDLDINVSDILSEITNIKSIYHVESNDTTVKTLLTVLREIKLCRVHHKPYLIICPSYYVVGILMTLLENVYTDSEAPSYIIGEEDSILLSPADIIIKVDKANINPTGSIINNPINKKQYYIINTTRLNSKDLDIIEDLNLLGNKVLSVINYNN